MRARRLALAALGLAFGLAACSSGSTTTQAPSGATTTTGLTQPPATQSGAAPSSTPRPTVPPTRFDDRVSLAGGGWLAAKCTGTGSPTILLEAGGTEGNMQEWGAQFPLQLASDATVCRYSRRGGEGSSEAPSPLTWDTMLGDVEQLLSTLKDKAGIGGPYVFVGWSFGGEVAYGEAIAHESETAGLVILDTDFPRDFMTGCMAAGGTKAECQAEFDKDREALVIEHDLIKTFRRLPDVPIVLVSALRPDPECTVEPGVGARYNDITAPDCVSLWQAIADRALQDWGAAGTVEQTRVDADHDGLILSAGTQIAGLIQALIAKG
jgi:pimeloyl-ACP methyl ester carboxylesterase